MEEIYMCAETGSNLSKLLAYYMLHTSVFTKTDIKS